MRVLLIGREVAPFETIVAMALARDGATVIRGHGTGAQPLHSRYYHEFLEHPPLHSEAFRPFTVDHARSNGETVLLPVTDAALVALQPIRPEIDRLMPVAAAPAEATAIALDKFRTAEAAGRVANSLSVPPIILAESADDAVARWTGPYPVIVKPRTGWGAEGIRLARDREELRATYGLVAETYHRPLVQMAVQCRVDRKFHLNYIFDHVGTLRSWYGHRVIAQHRSIGLGVGRQKTAGGIALLSESWFDEDVLNRGRRLMQALGWRGLGVVEGAFDERDGRPYLFEINARLGSTQSLSLYRGVNVALDACRVALRQPPTEDLCFREGIRAKLDPVRLLQSRRPSVIARIPDPRFVSGLSGLTDLRPPLEIAWRAVRRLIARAI